MHSKVITMKGFSAKQGVFLYPKTNKKVGLGGFLRERIIVTSSILCFKKVFLATMKSTGWQGA